MFCVYVVLPTQTILRGTNILSILADEVAGKWLRVLVVIDCVLVLSGGVVDGICSANALIDRLARLVMSFVCNYQLEFQMNFQETMYSQNGH